MGNSMANEPASAADLRAFAMRLLARREYGVRELEQRLCKKFRGQEDIQQLANEVAEALVEEGALSDQRYIKAFVRSRRQRSQGPLKIRAELQQKQVSQTLLEQLISELTEQDSEAWVNLAAKWLARQHPEELDFPGRARFYRRMVNRGFSHEQAMAALDKHPTA